MHRFKFPKMNVIIMSLKYTNKLINKKQKAPPWGPLCTRPHCPGLAKSLVTDSHHGTDAVC